MRRFSPVTRALIIAALFGVTILAAQYMRAVIIEHKPFEPDWLIVGAACALSFVADFMREKMLTR